MNRIKPFTPATRIQFEQAARALGHRNFDMRSKDHYCVTELNTLAKGFCMALVERAPVLEVVNG